MKILNKYFGLLLSTIFICILIYQNISNKYIEVHFNDHPIIYIGLCAPFLLLVICKIGYYRLYISHYGNYLAIRYKSFKKIIYKFERFILINSIILFSIKSFLEIIFFNNISWIMNILFLLSLIIIQNLQLLLELLFNEKIAVYVCTILCIISLPIADFLYNNNLKMVLNLFFINNFIQARIMNIYISLVIDIAIILILIVINIKLIKRKEII